MSSEQIDPVQHEVSVAITKIVHTDALRLATLTLSDIKNGLVTVVDSDEMQADIGDMRLRLRKGIRHVETSITDLFRPRKMFEKMLREHFKNLYVDPMEAAVAMLDRELLAWDTEKVRRVAQEEERVALAAREAAEAVQREQDAAQRAADEAQAQAGLFAAQGQHAAAVAAQEAATVLAAVAADAPPPFEVQPMAIAPAARSVKGAEATTFIRRTLVASLEEPESAMRRWAEAFVFDEKACAKFFDLENLNRPKDNESVLVGGVRFTVQTSISGKAR